jgi:outer membrane protein
MKKFLTVIVLTSGLLFAKNAGAQMKIGYIKIDDMVALMPETAKLDSIMERFQTDSLQQEYASIVANYQFKDSVYRDSLKTPPAVRKQIEKELPTLIYQIQNWQQISQKASEDKQNEYLAPIYRKVYDAVRAVAKEKGYTHVFTKEAFLVAPEGDDLIGLVAARLKVKIPPPKQTGN